MNRKKDELASISTYTGNRTILTLTPKKIVHCLYFNGTSMHDSVTKAISGDVISINL